MLCPVGEKCSGFHREACRLAVAIRDTPLHAVGMFPVGPRAQLFDVLPKAEHDQLLDWVLAQEGSFRSATVVDGIGGRPSHDANTRSALTSRNLGPLEQSLRGRLLHLLPELMRCTGMRGQMPDWLELELAAYGDGGRYAPHVDLAFGEGRKPVSNHPGRDRVLSAVYYLHAQPKGFSGGELRLYPLGHDPASDSELVEFVDVEPIDNSLVAFHSWAPHEVRLVNSPSGQFADSRFSLNCWYCRSLGGEAG